MRNIRLITGGGRSGKSYHAQNLAEHLAKSEKALFLATCPPLDDELQARIARHQQDRDSRVWDVVEEQVAVVGVLEKWETVPVILLDCITLWVGNLLHYNHQMTEDHIARQANEVVDICKRQKGELILVTNEVGLGVVPNNAMARKYRDLLGRCNQVFAAAANEVVLMVSGIPMQIKGKK